MKLQRSTKLFVSFLVGLLLVACAQTVTPKVAQSPPTSTSDTTTTVSPSPETTEPSKEPDVVYVPTPDAVVDRMLTMAKVGKDDVIYDLGSGDGRIVITAAQKYGARGVGIEIRPDLIEQARENAKKAGVSDRVEFRQADLFETDFSEATVISLYLLPDLNVKLRPKLLQLKPGTRVVSHDFDMGEWKPQETATVEGPSRQHTVYFWTIPNEPPANLR